MLISNTSWAISSPVFFLDLLELDGAGTFHVFIEVFLDVGFVELLGFANGQCLGGDARDVHLELAGLAFVAAREALGEAADRQLSLVVELAFEAVSLDAFHLALGLGEFDDDVLGGLVVVEAFSPAP